MEEQVTELIKRINEASPVVWEAAQRQVQVDLIFNLILLAVLLGLSISGIWAARLIAARWQNPDIEPEDLLALDVVWGVIALMSLIFLLSTIHEVLSLSLSPEWAAIDLILSKLPK